MSHLCFFSGMHNHVLKPTQLTSIKILCRTWQESNFQ